MNCKNRMVAPLRKLDTEHHPTLLCRRRLTQVALVAACRRNDRCRMDIEQTFSPAIKPKVQKKAEPRKQHMPKLAISTQKTTSKSVRITNRSDLRGAIFFSSTSCISASPAASVDWKTAEEHDVGSQDGGWGQRHTRPTLTCQELERHPTPRSRGTTTERPTED